MRRSLSVRGLLAVGLLWFAGCTGVESYALSPEEFSADGGIESDGSISDVTGVFDKDCLRRLDGGSANLTIAQINYCTVHQLARGCPFYYYLVCRGVPIPDDFQ